MTRGGRGIKTEARQERKMRDFVEYIIASEMTPFKGFHKIQDFGNPLYMKGDRQL